MLGEPLYGGLFLAGFVAMLVAAFVIDRRGARRIEVAAADPARLALVGSALALAGDPAALTDGDGSCHRSMPPIRRAFERRARPAGRSGRTSDAGELLEAARATAWRDGSAVPAGLPPAAAGVAVEVERVGAGGDLLLWRFAGAGAAGPAGGGRQARRRARPASGSPRPGVLAALVDGDGRLLAANGLFTERALSGADRAPVGSDLRLPT